MLNTEEQALLSLISSDVPSRNIFFSKVSDPKFFYPLKTEGYFEPKTVPDAIEVEGGLQYPYWAPLSYLQKLAIKVKSGEAMDLADEILYIITSITVHIDSTPKPNARLYYIFIGILSELPNDRITEGQLSRIIPLWLKVGDTFNTCPDITEKLLPKFLEPNPTSQDKIKADFILRSILNSQLYIKPKASPPKWAYNRDLYWLNEVILKRKLYSRIAEHLDSSIVFYIADELKKIVRSEFGSEYEFKYLNFKFTLSVAENNLILLLETESNANITIQEFEKYSNAQLIEMIIADVLKAGLIEPNLGQFKERLSSAINYGIGGDLSMFRLRSFHDEEEEDDYHDVGTSFAAYLQRISESIMSSNADKGEKIISTFLSLKYRNPIFKRLAIYLISKSWPVHSKMFRDLLMSDLAVHILTEHHLSVELYRFLRINAKALSEDDVQLLKDRLDELEPKNQTVEHIERWRLRWLSAVKDLPQFTEEYNRLLEKYSIQEDYYQDTGKVQIRSGDESPFTSEQILEMDISRLSNEIETFKSDTWLGPTARGFSSALEQAVAEHPDKFVSNIDSFLHSPFVYVYGILSGFQSAWKNKRTFDWSQVLGFCISYVSNEKYIGDQLTIPDGNWGYKADWVDGIIGNLITEGTQSDKHGFDITLLPTAEKLLELIIRRQLPTSLDRTNSMNGDYPMFAINTTAGKVYRALLDCSLRNKRNKIFSTWTVVEKPLFMWGLEQGILEIHVYLGWHFRQFNYLDSEWVNEYISNLTTKNIETWKAFMGGYLFPDPSNDPDLYKKMLPNYNSAIALNFFPKHIGGFNSGLTRHIACFYFWKQDEGTLIHKFIDSASQDQLGDLVHFLRSNHSYVESLDTIKQEQFRQRILSLWEYLISKFDQQDFRLDTSIPFDFADLIMYFEELSEPVYKLVSYCFKFKSPRNEGFFVLQHLAQLLARKNTKENAQYAANIFLDLLNISFLTYEEKMIQSLVEAIYQHPESKPQANKICELYLVRGIEFLRNTYAKYNK